MPYKRYARRKMRRSSRSKIYKAAGSQLWRDVKWLKSVVNVEKKYIDTSATTTSSTTPALVLLNGCTTGDAGTNRDGQSIKMSSLYSNFLWSINASASTTYVRVILFMDHQSNATAPGAADLLTNTSSVLSTLLIGNGKRFTVLADIRKTLSINGTEIVRFKIFKKLHAHVRFNTGNAGTVADIQTNTLYMLHMSDQATNVVVFAYNNRVRFIDN